MFIALMSKGFAQTAKIPLTGVSGWFRSFLESGALAGVMEFPTRQCGDRSSPFYLFYSIDSEQKINEPMNRPDLNDPQTAVWGIQLKCSEIARCRKDLNDPLTAVSGIHVINMLLLRSKVT